MADETVSVALEADSKGFVKAFNEASMAVKNTVGAATALVKAYHWAENQIRSIIDKIVSQYKKMAFAVIAGVGGSAVAMKKNVDTFRSFETAMANVSTVTDSTVTSIDAMSKSVIALSTKMPQSADELAAGLYEVNSAGYQGAEAMKVLETTAKFSTAGVTDMGTSVRATTALLHAYGLGAGQASHVTDVLFKAVEVGQMTASEFAMNIGDWASSAASLNVPFESAAAALANMTTYGALPANQAATSLNAIFRQLVRPSEEMGRTLKRMGYSSGKAALESMGLAETLHELWLQTGKSETGFQALFQESEAFKGALGMVTNGYENLVKIQGEFNDSSQTAGTTQRAFEKQMQTLDNQLKLLGNSLRAFGYSAGAFLTPIFKIFVSGARSLVNVFNGLPSAIKAPLAMLGLMTPLISSIGVMFAVSAAKAKLFAVVLQKVAQMRIVAAVPALQRLSVALANAGGPIKLLVTKIALFRNADAALRASMMRTAITAGAYMAAFAAIAIVIGSFVSGLQEAKQKAEALKASFNQVGEGGISSAKQLTDEFQRAVSLRDEFLSKTGGGSFWNGILAGAQMVTPFIENTKMNAAQAAAAMGDMAQQYLDLASAARFFMDANGQTADAVLGALSKMAQEGVVSMDVLISSYKQWTELQKDEGVKAYESQLALVQQMNEIMGTNTTVEITDFMTPEQAAEYQRLKAMMDDLTVKTKEYAVEQGKINAANEASSASGQSLGLALQKIADKASTATERLEAFRTILDIVLGSELSLRDAQASMMKALEDVGAAMRDNGENFDLSTEKGRALQQAFSQAGDTARNLATIVYEQTGSMDASQQVLAEYAASMIALAKNAGYGEDGIRQMIEIMGLTPQNIATMISLPGIDPAIASLLQTAGLLYGIDGYVAKAGVQISISTWFQNQGPGSNSMGTAPPPSPSGIIDVNSIINSIVGNIPKGSSGGGRGGGGGGGGGSNAWKPSATQSANMAAALAKPLQNLLTGSLGQQWQDQMVKQWYDTATRNILAEGKTRLGASILKQAEEQGQDPADALAQMTDAYNRLVKDVGKANADIALDQFESLDAFVEYVDGVEAATEHLRDVEDWKYQHDKISNADYLKILKDRLKNYDEYSTEWMQITDEIANVEQDAKDEELRLNQAKLDMGDMSKQAYLDYLNEQLKGLDKYSEEYMRIWGEIQGVEADMQAELDQQTQAVEDFSQGVVDSFNDIKDGVVAPILEATNLIQAFGDQANLSFDQVQGYYSHMLEGTTRWVEVIKALKEKGVNGDFLNQLIQAGPSSLSYAESILAMGTEGINFINTSMADISNLATGLGTDIATGSVGTLNQNDNSVSISVGSVEIVAEMPNGVTMADVQTAIDNALRGVATTAANHA